MDFANIDFDKIDSVGKSRRKNRKARAALFDRGPLFLESREGYRRRWVAEDPDKPGALERHAEKGYTFVRTEEPKGDTSITRPGKPGGLVTRPGGRAVTMYAMEVPERVAQENDEMKAARRKKRRQSYNDNTGISNLEGDQGGFYGQSLKDG